MTERPNTCWMLRIFDAAPRAMRAVAAVAALAGVPASMAQFEDPSELSGGGSDEVPDGYTVRNPLKKDNKGPIKGDIKVDEQLIVDLHVKDEDLANVLEMLSIQSQKNIVASKNVSATITANLYGVTFYEALDAILHANGYGYIEQGNRITVYTLDELKVIEEQMRVKVARLIKLNYINAVDAAAFVKPLLSEAGQITANGKTSDFASKDLPDGRDDFSNETTLIVHDYEENVAEVEKLLRELDARPAQVLIEATILQTALNESNAFGVDFTVLGSMNFSQFVGGASGPLKAVDNLITGVGSSLSGGSASAVRVPGDDYGSAVTSSAGNTSGPSTFKGGIVAGDVAAFIRLLDEVSDTNIISRPNILTLNRQSARVLVGRKVGYLQTTSTDTSTTQTVEFLDTGTQLYFRPFVSTDGLIRMEIKPQVSEAVIREATDSNGAAVTIPDEITNELTTNVMVRDGQTIVLGGLFRESTQTARRQIPWAGDLPIIGAAFRGHDDEIERSEIIFMITPNLVNDQVLVAQGERAVNAIEHVRTGAREGLLPFSREKITSQLNVQADRLAMQGKTSQALWKLRRSLRMSPSQTDAIILRERLAADKAVWPDRGMLDEILDGEAQARHANLTPLEPRGARKSRARATVTHVETPVIVEETTPYEPSSTSDVEIETSYTEQWSEPDAQSTPDESFDSTTDSTFEPTTDDSSTDDTTDSPNDDSDEFYQSPWDTEPDGQALRLTPIMIGGSWAFFLLTL